MATIQVRINEVTKSNFDDVASEINFERESLNKLQKTNSELFDAAVNLLIANKSKVIKS
jgi:hypothetical protein